MYRYKICTYTVRCTDCETEFITVRKARGLNPYNIL